jgi:SAM-dependent methyltransferase
MKPILDACCGGRYFWFDSKNPLALFMDNRVALKGHSKWRKNHSVEPDIVADFRRMPFPDKSFKLVIFDPPHLTNCGPQGDMGKRYGRLNKLTWRDDIAAGFKECWRVLDVYGVLIFKWSELSIKLKDVEPFFPTQPLIGHRTGRMARTIWCTFFKNEVLPPPAVHVHDHAEPPIDGDPCWYSRQQKNRPVTEYLEHICDTCSYSWPEECLKKRGERKR